MNTKANKLEYKQIKIGDSFSFEQIIDEVTVGKFAELTGDFNPLHCDEPYAQATPWGGRVAHGMLLASFFSKLVGMICPGERALYLSQYLNFKNPLGLGSKRINKIIVTGKVVNKFDAVKIIEMKTRIVTKAGQIVIDGMARVKVR